jgi:hypothetical protein
MDKPKRELTPEQLEALKARLLNAREAKLAKDKSSYDANKDKIKEEGLKKRTMNKVKALVTKGAVKEEELKEILPKKEEQKQMPVDKVVDEIVKEIPLPKRRVPKPKPAQQHNDIPFDEEEKPIRSKPIQIPQKKDKYMKLVYYREPSKAVLKKLNKLQDSSSEDESSSDEPPVVRGLKQQSVINDEDAYYRALAKKLYS